MELELVELELMLSVTALNIPNSLLLFGSGVLNTESQWIYSGLYLNTTASFNGYIVGNTLTVSGINAGGQILIGSTIINAATIFSTNTSVIEYDSGSGGNGTYYVNFSEVNNTTPVAMTSTSPQLGQIIVDNPTTPTTLYLFQYGGPTIFIINIATLTSPSLVTTIVTPTAGNSGTQNILAKIQTINSINYLYIGTTSGFYNAYNITTPTSPTIAYNINTGALTNMPSALINNNGFDVDTSGNIYVANRYQNTSPLNGNIFQIFSSYKATPAPAVVNSVMVSGVYLDGSITTVPQAGQLTFTFNNISGTPPSGPLTSITIIPLVTSLPIVFPATTPKGGTVILPNVWNLTGSITNGSLPNTVNVTVSYNNNSGSAAIFINNFTVVFIVTYY